MRKRAVIVVDIQNEYFASGKLPLVNIEQAAAKAAEVIDAARQNKDLLVHVHHDFRTRMRLCSRRAQTASTSTNPWHRKVMSRLFSRTTPPTHS